MFCPEGYLTLREIKFCLLQYAWAQTPESTSADERMAGGRYWSRDEIAAGVAELDDSLAYGKWLFHLFCELYQDDIKVTLPSGALLRVAPAIFTKNQRGTSNGYSFISWWIYPSKRAERWRLSLNFLENIDEDYCTVRPPLTANEAVQRLLNPLQHLPLCIERSLLPANLGNLAELVMSRYAAIYSEPANNPIEDRHRNIVEQIVSAILEGKVRNKSEAKARFGKGLKSEAWLAVWAEAARARPDLRLSKPGPKGPRYNS